MNYQKNEISLNEFFNFIDTQPNQWKLIDKIRSSIFTFKLPISDFERFKSLALSLGKPNSVSGLSIIDVLIEYDIIDDKCVDYIFSMIDYQDILIILQQTQISLSYPHLKNSDSYRKLSDVLALMEK